MWLLVWAYRATGMLALCVSGDWIHGFVLSRQTLHQLNYPPPLALGVLLVSVLKGLQECRLCCVLLFSSSQNDDMGDLLLGNCGFQTLFRAEGWLALEVLYPSARSLIHN